MKTFIDFFPIFAFFVAYMWKVKRLPEDQGSQAIIFATGVLIVATIIAVALSWIKLKKIEKTHIFTLIAAVVFGGLTIYFNSPDFIKWKVSIANWIFALVFLGSHYIGKKPIIKMMMEKMLDMPDKKWLRLSWAWIMFSITLGVLNYIIAFHFPGKNDIYWVNFKFFGTMGLTLVFMVVQAFILREHLLMEDERQPAEETPEADEADQESAP